jgi:ABC-type antimicrobial peptide transport system permease subunit
MVVSEISLYKALSDKIGDNAAQLLVEGIKHEVKNEFETQKGIFLTKEDKIDIMRSISIVGLVQFLAIVTAVIGILNFMHH